MFSVPLLGQNRALPRGVAPGWYQKAVAAIEDREYSIRNVDAPGIYAAVNHDQHLDYWFTDKGYGVGNFNEDGSTKGLWKEQFLLTGIGRSGYIARAGAAVVSRMDDHRLGFDYGGYAIKYDHEKPGMEQTFVIRKRPSGVRPLCIALQLSGDLRATVTDDVLRLYAADDRQNARLVYDQLVVWDSHHRRLSAHMRLDEGNRLRLTVDDSRADYPLTVDPFARGTSTSFVVQNILGSNVLDASYHTLFGYSVAGADLNADGISDLVIGSPVFTQATVSGGTLSTTVSATVTGAAFVYYGVSGSGPSTTPSKVLQPTALTAGSLFGYSMSSAGNATGGSYAGLVVGAPGQIDTYSYGNVSTGAVFVYSPNKTNGFFDNTVGMGPQPNGVLTLTQSEFTASNSAPIHAPLFGWSVADAGDINSDGVDDIIVGSPAYQDDPAGVSGVISGRIDIFKGSSTGLSTTHTTTIYGDQAGSLFGFSVNTAGHFVGDAAHSSIVVGAPGNLITASLVHGIVYIFTGSGAPTGNGITVTKASQATGTAGAIISDPNGFGSLFGFSVSTAGDVDNNGVDDVVIGAPTALVPTGSLLPPTAVAAGRAYVVYGGAISNGNINSSRAMVTLSSPRASLLKNVLFGWSVANTGNVTGDAAGDIVIGEPGGISITSLIGAALGSLGISTGLNSSSGQAYVYAGKANAAMNTTPVLTVSDAATSPNLLGYTVRSVGDVDGDGNPDIAIAEPSGSLDLGFSLATIPSSAGTLTTATNGGFVTSANAGTVQLYFGFANGTLPLTMTSFTGQAQGNQTLLNWTTLEEQNTGYFIVERSLDGKNFTNIGRVAAAGNSDVQMNYSFVDPAPSAGNNYYRLDMVDLDGQATYSNIVVVNFNTTSGSGIMVYPNPAHGSFQLLFQNMASGRYGMNLLNSAGQLVMVKYIQVGDGTSYNEMVSLGTNLSPGTYIVRVVDSQNRSYITRIVIE